MVGTEARELAPIEVEQGRGVVRVEMRWLADWLAVLELEAAVPEVAAPEVVVEMTAALEVVLTAAAVVVREETGEVVVVVTPAAADVVGSTVVVTAAAMVVVVVTSTVVAETWKAKPRRAAAVNQEGDMFK